MTGFTMANPTEMKIFFFARAPIHGFRWQSGLINTALASESQRLLGFGGRLEATDPIRHRGDADV
jgi:hypothetical protein